MRRLRTAVLGKPVAGECPHPRGGVAVDAAGHNHYRYGDLMPLPGMTGDLADMALYAGQSVHLVHQVLAAARLVHDVAGQAAATVGALHDLAV